MKKSLFLFLIIVIFPHLSYSQLPNHNTYLLRQLDNYSSYSACWGYTADNGREYALLGCFTGTSFVDITDSTNIHEVDFQTGVNNGWREMKTYSHYAYIVSEGTNSRLQIVDLQYLPDSVHLVTVWNYPGYNHTHSISQSGPYLYLNGGSNSPNGGVTVVDITSPELPVKRGQWTTRYVHDCRVLNDTIWACNISSGRVTVINAINKDSLREVTNWNNLPSPAPHNSDITRDRKYILVTDENSAPGKLKVWNIEDLSNITFITNWQPTGITTAIVHNVEIVGNYAFVAHYSAGIRIIDISNPVVPTEVAWYDTRPQDNNTSYSGCWGIYKFPSGKVIGSDGSNGLFVIKTTFSLSDNTRINLKVLMEGMYIPLSDQLSRKDTITVLLHQSTPPYSVIDSANIAIDSISFTGLAEFFNVPTDTYYITVKHFNCIETWSKAGGEYLINNGTLFNYDFTTSASQAFGNNLKLIGTKYTIYSGDVNQDGVIDGADLSNIGNDAFIFLTGLRVQTDLDGNNIVDGSDYLIADNNSFNFISVSRP